MNYTDAVGANIKIGDVVYRNNSFGVVTRFGSDFIYVNKSKTNQSDVLICDSLLIEKGREDIINRLKSQYQKDIDAGRREELKVNTHGREMSYCVFMLNPSSCRQYDNEKDDVVLIAVGVPKDKKTRDGIQLAYSRLLDVLPDIHGGLIEPNPSHLVKMLNRSSNEYDERTGEHAVVSKWSSKPLTPKEYIIRVPTYSETVNGAGQPAKRFIPLNEIEAMLSQYDAKKEFFISSIMSPREMKEFAETNNITLKS